MGEVEEREMRQRGLGGLSMTGTFLAVALYLVTPLGLLLGQAIGPSRPAGFGRGAESLSLLGTRSILLSVVPAMMVSLFCTLCSLSSRFSPRFLQFYRTWLLVLLFTNPLFLVFGFTVLLANWNPNIATMIATCYILLPLPGLIIQAEAEELPLEQIAMARALGSRPTGVAIRHILPSIRGAILLATLLGAIYALGFYLVPSFVGMGQVATLGTAIDHAANQIGDWKAACQLSLVTLAVQMLVVSGVGITGKLTRRHERA